MDNIDYIKLLYANSSQPAYLIDKHENCLWANQATFDMYKCTEEMFYNYYSRLTYLLDSGALRNAVYREVLDKKLPVSHWNKMTDTNQNFSYYYTVQQPILNESGDVEYVIGTCWKWEDVRNAFFSFDEATAPSNNIQLVTGEQFNLIYESPIMRRLVQQVSRITNTNVPILLQGETGCGKDVFANYIHYSGSRKKNEMIAINCASIPPSMFESEMFGYVKGAFTGADSRGRAGLIELANNSTLFLDEINSLPLDQQAKLLRVLETQTIRPLGSSKTVSVNFRLITATNQNLKQLVSEGKFREDLYYRLNIMSYNIPPLRDRKEDILPLSEFYLNKYCDEFGMEYKFSDQAISELMHYQWPGNVRELKNCIERAVLCSESADGFIQHIPFSSASDDAESLPMISSGAFTEDLDSQVARYEKELISKALKEYGSMSRAASALGVPLSTFSRKIAKYNIK